MFLLFKLKLCRKCRLKVYLKDLQNKLLGNDYETLKLDMTSADWQTPRKNHLFSPKSYALMHKTKTKTKKQKCGKKKKNLMGGKWVCLPTNSYFSHSPRQQFQNNIFRFFFHLRNFEKHFSGYFSMSDLRFFRNALGTNFLLDSLKYCLETSFDVFIDLKSN